MPLAARKATVTWKGVIRRQQGRGGSRERYDVQIYLPDRFDPTSDGNPDPFDRFAVKRDLATAVADQRRNVFHHDILAINAENLVNAFIVE